MYEAPEQYIRIPGVRPYFEADALQGDQIRDANRVCHKVSLRLAPRQSIDANNDQRRGRDAYNGTIHHHHIIRVQFDLSAGRPGFVNDHLFVNPAPA